MYTKMLVALVLILVALATAFSFKISSRHVSRDVMRVFSSQEEEGKQRRRPPPSAVGSGSGKRQSASPSSTGKNINEGNLQKNMDYHRNKQEREEREWRRSDVQQGPSLSSNAKRRVYNGPEGGSRRRPTGNRKAGEFSDALADQWQSGRVFQKRGGQRGGGRRRNDPWWMRDEERNNPRILPQYKPWWLENILVDSSWKISDLRKEAMRRADANGKVGSAAGAGGYTEEQINDMKKVELVDFLVGLTEQYSLANDGFTSIEFVDSTGGNKPPCYPQVYEGGQDKMENMVLEAYDQILNRSE